MSLESLDPRGAKSPGEFYDRVERYRVEVEYDRGMEGGAAEKPGHIREMALVNLESFGRALLDEGQNLSGAVELLDLAGALDKADIQRKLVDWFVRLRKATSRREQGELLELSKRLAGHRQSK